MRLSYKVFMTSALVILALVAVATWSLLAISRLVDVNRGIATQSLPALRMGTSLREQLGGLTRTEMDARPAAKDKEPAQKAWNDRAAEMAKDFALLRSFLATYRRLSIATAQLADGAFTHPIPVTSRDEIGEPARSFKRMAERLREVDHLKEAFFSHISHELRTPLTSLKEATHLLLERVQGLAIVKGLVEAHGGRIGVESEEGRGSRLLVRPPRDGAPPVGAAPTGSER
jgi:signal transduction histidine kinase